MNKKLASLILVAVITSTGLFAQRYSEDELDKYQKVAVDPIKQAVEDSKKMADQMAAKQAQEVSDPDAGKAGGPPTITVIKLMNGTPTSSTVNNEQVMMATIAQKIMGVSIKEIKRGEPLTSLISPRIPTGTKVFPIRIVAVSASGPENNVDLYFYKDEFGEWASIVKN
jgi:hypothetical protein